MTNAEILALPDVVRALTCWWDECRGWYQGVTSAVVADLLEEYGWDCGPKKSTEANLFDWLRSTIIVKPSFRPHVEVFEYAIGAFNAYAGNVVHDHARRMFTWLWRKHDPHFANGFEYRRDARVLVNPADAEKIARSQEMRQYMMHAARYADWSFTTGILPDRVYGNIVTLTPEQPEGIVSSVWHDVRVDARVW